jgi:general secretion pathway protein K
MDFPRDDDGSSAMRITDYKSPIANLREERGAVLIIVLWVFIFLFVVALDFAASVREEGTAAARYSEEAQNYYLALAGFQQGLYKLFSSSSQSDKAGAAAPLQATELVDGAWSEGELQGAKFRVRLLDEAGKINLNRADEDMLRRVFSNLGIEEPRRSTLIDSIMDWRDEDDLHRASGAESDYYSGLPNPYTARNGPFDTVEDLLWVKGMTVEDFYGSEDDGVRSVGLREVLTVDSPSNRVNLRTAPPEVIHALMGLPLEKSRAFVEERKKLSDKTLADLIKLLSVDSVDVAQRYFVFVPASIITIEAAGYRNDSAFERRVKGVVRLVGANRGFELMRWYDRAPLTYERKEP